MKSDKIMAKATKKPQCSVGRPKAKVDVEILKNLASIGCPTYEIASVMNVSARTLKRNFAEIIEQYREQGKASLRKKMYDKAVKKVGGKVNNVVSGAAEGLAEFAKDIQKRGT